MEEKEEPQDILRKILLFLAQYEKSKRLTQIFEESKKSFASLFKYSSVYLRILEKAKVYTFEGNQSTAIKLFDLTDKSTFQQSLFVPAKKCPKLYAETHEDYQTGNALGLMEYDFDSSVKEYSLIINGKGNPYIISFANKGTLRTCCSQPQSDVMFLDLPLLVSGIMKSSSVSSKNILKTIVDKNPMSSLANIFKYIESNNNSMDVISSNIFNIGSLISETKATFSNFNEKGFGTYFGIKNYFTWNNGQEKIPYIISGEKESALIKLNIESLSKNQLLFKRSMEYCPALIKFDKNEITPYYFSQKFYKQLGEDPSSMESEAIFESKNLIKIETLVDEITEAKRNEYEQYQQENNEKIAKMLFDCEHDSTAYNGYLDLFEKNGSAFVWKEEWTSNKEVLDNINSKIIKELKDFISAKKSEDKISLQGKTIRDVEKNIKDSEKLIDEISCILGNIYKNEILMINI